MCRAFKHDVKTRTRCVNINTFITTNTSPVRVKQNQNETDDNSVFLSIEFVLLLIEASAGMILCHAHFDYILFTFFATSHHHDQYFG